MAVVFGSNMADCKPVYSIQLQVESNFFKYKTEVQFKILYLNVKPLFIPLTHFNYLSTSDDTYTIYNKI